MGEGGPGRSAEEPGVEHEQRDDLVGRLGRGHQRRVVGEAEVAPEPHHRPPHAPILVVNPVSHADPGTRHPGMRTNLQDHDGFKAVYALELLVRSKVDPELLDLSLIHI